MGIVLVFLSMDNPMSTAALYSFTVIGTICLIFITCCSAASFLDKDLCFFSIWRTKYWVLFGAFLESGDFNKEWFTKFKPTDFQYIVKKPSRGIGLGFNSGFTVHRFSLRKKNTQLEHNMSETQGENVSDNDQMLEMKTKRGPTVYHEISIDGYVAKQACF